jgi:hypothetical protein
VQLNDSETSGLGTIFFRGQTISYAGLQDFYSFYKNKYNETFLIISYWHSLWLKYMKVVNCGNFRWWYNRVNVPRTDILGLILNDLHFLQAVVKNI